MDRSAPPQTHLRQLREASGQSLRSVARRSGVDPAHLSRIERGQVNPSLATLRRILATIGNSDLSALLGLYDSGAMNRWRPGRKEGG